MKMYRHCKLDDKADLELIFGKDADISNFAKLQFKTDHDRYCNGNILDDRNFNRYCKKDCRSLIDMGDYYECALDISFDSEGELTCRTREKK